MFPSPYQIKVPDARFQPWSPRADLNRRPRPYQGRALPTELQGHVPPLSAFTKAMLPLLLRCSEKPSSVFLRKITAFFIKISPPYSCLQRRQHKSFLPMHRNRQLPLMLHPTNHIFGKIFHKIRNNSYSIDTLGTFCMMGA